MKIVFAAWVTLSFLWLLIEWDSLEKWWFNLICAAVGGFAATAILAGLVVFWAWAAA